MIENKIAISATSVVFDGKVLVSSGMLTTPTEFPTITLSSSIKQLTPGQELTKDEFRENIDASVSFVHLAFTSLENIEILQKALEKLKSNFTAKVQKGEFLMYDGNNIKTITEFLKGFDIKVTKDNNSQGITLIGVNNKPIISLTPGHFIVKTPEGIKFV